MLSLQLIFLLTRIINKIIGKKTAINFLNFTAKKQKFFYTEKIYDFTEKKLVTQLTLFLPGKGCAWAKKTGGCTMCAFGKEAIKIGKNFSGKDLLLLYEIAVNLTQNENPFSLAIYNGGSFLNDEEIPFEVQIEICQKVKKHPSLSKLLVESRVEYITEQKIKTLKDALGNKILIIGIGLESQDDKIRNEFIKKGLSKKNYERTIKLLKKQNVKTLTYVFLKPIYIPEKEAIEEAVKTILYAFKTGTDEVALEIAFIQENTLMAKLFQEKRYKPPWLWSIIEVIKKTHKAGPIRIGSFNDMPPPIATAENCPLCSLKVKMAIQKFRETNDLSMLNNLDCQCRKEWEKYKLREP